MLNTTEIDQILKLTRSSFDKYVSKYDERKYPPAVYEQLLRAFGVAGEVKAGDLRKAILWKFGHSGKRRIPVRHETLIAELQQEWPELVSNLAGSAAEVYARLAAVAGGPSRYITRSFLLHLLRPATISIIDQHNFRAVNYYLEAVRSGWRSKSRPSTYADLAMVSGFVRDIRSGWKTIDPGTAPSERDLDRFLMMFGKALKSRKRHSLSRNRRARLNGSASSASTRTAITLPFGGPSADFDVGKLIEHLKESEFDYIIQGQSNCALSVHPKPRSLDAWLRRNFAANRDTKQAVNEVIDQLVSTGLFEVDRFRCPDSGRKCKGIRLATKLFAPKSAAKGWLPKLDCSMVGQHQAKTDAEISEVAGPTFPKEIARDYQEEVEEEARLTAGPSQLEFSRTKEIVLRYLPPTPATVLDVGGASGSYALWLAERGHRVHLIDLVPRLVEEAWRRSEASAHRICSCQIGDARDLAFNDCVASGVLLLGPLYHLTEKAQRLRALQEAYRVLLPGGVMFAAGISRYASALDGVARDLFADPTFSAIVQQDLERGQHRNETDRRDYFTTAYFHRPDELQAEVVSVGFKCQAVLGLEGPGWILADFDKRWADARKREDLLRVARALEKEESILGVSAHLLAVGTKK